MHDVKLPTRGSTSTGEASGMQGTVSMQNSFPRLLYALHAVAALTGLEWYRAGLMRCPLGRAGWGEEVGEVWCVDRPLALYFTSRQTFRER